MSLSCKVCVQLPLSGLDAINIHYLEHVFQVEVNDQFGPPTIVRAPPKIRVNADGLVYVDYTGLEGRTLMVQHIELAKLCRIVRSALVYLLPARAKFIPEVPEHTLSPERGGEPWQVLEQAATEYIDSHPKRFRRPTGLRRLFGYSSWHKRALRIVKPKVSHRKAKAEMQQIEAALEKFERKLVPLAADLAKALRYNSDEYFEPTSLEIPLSFAGKTVFHLNGEEVEMHVSRWGKDNEPLEASLAWTLEIGLTCVLYMERGRAYHLLAPFKGLEVYFKQCLMVSVIGDDASIQISPLRKKYLDYYLRRYAY